jgi:hypothetical protein
VHHRHLLPNEIDLLLDEETGFGVQPLKEHVRACADCRAELDDARALATALSSVAPLSPRYGLADRVMARVPVFVPWHVAARDSVLRWLPTGRVPHVLAAALVAMVGSVVTGITLWIATRGDVLAMVTGLAGEGARSTIAQVLDDAVLGLVGSQTFAAVQQVGPVGAAFAGAGFVIAGLATIIGLRRIAVSARRS